MLKISINNNFTKIPSDTIGIDMGHSLSKFAYLEEKDLSLSCFSTQTNIESINYFINSKKDLFNVFNFTGGKSFKLYNEYLKDFDSYLLNEFEANVKGVEFLYTMEKKRKLSRSLVVTVGTGTSIVLKNDGVQHLGGSALGGGFFMGILKALFNFNDFDKTIELGKKGNRYNVDLKVSDIYNPEDKRVNSLFREFTAASLGKIDETFNFDTMKKEDFISSIISLIGENIGTIATIIATKYDIAEIVFCGGFLKKNKILKQILSLICKVNQKKAVFLKNSEYCAAIGALLL